MLKFTVHTEGLEEVLKNIQLKATQTEHAVALQIEKDTRPFVPAETLSLSNRTQVREQLVIYPGPYARFLYNGKVMIYEPTGSTFAPLFGKKVLTDRNLVFSKAVHGQAQDHWFEASKAQNLEKWKRIAAKEMK